MRGEEVRTAEGPVTAGRRGRWPLLARALLAVALAAIGGGLLFMEAPQAYADTRKGCKSIEGPGYGGYGCNTGSGFEAGVYVVGYSPPTSNPGSPGFYRPPQSIDCSSVGNVPTPTNYWLYNYCNGTNWRYSPSTGLLVPCPDAGLGLSVGPGMGTYYGLALEEACMPREGPPYPPSHQPEQACVDQAKRALNPPRPQIQVNPGVGLTGLPSYFWISNYQDDMRRSVSFPASCSVGEWRAVSGHLSAWVVRYLWDFGDGWGMTTTTPGAAWPEWVSEVYHTYERSSLQQPDQKYLVRVWAFWQGSFTLDAEREQCTTDQNGRRRCVTERRTFGPYDLGEIYIVGRLRYPVQQLQSVLTAPDQGQ
jgi:hypothetical protein